MRPKAAATKIRIMLVEDHILMRMGLVSATRIEPDMVVIAEAEDGQQALENFRKCQPDVVIVDLRLPGMSGLELIKELREISKYVKILVLTSYGGGDDVSRAIQNGASGYVTKDMPLARVLEAVRMIHDGKQYIPQEIAGRMSQYVHSELSPRELEVLRLVGQGRSNKEIATALGIVEATVKTHFTNIFAKLGAADRAQAILIAIKRQILQMD